MRQSIVAVSSIYRHSQISLSLSLFPSSLSLFRPVCNLCSTIGELMLLLFRSRVFSLSFLFFSFPSDTILDRRRITPSNSHLESLVSFLTGSSWPVEFERRSSIDHQHWQRDLPSSNEWWSVSINPWRKTTNQLNLLERNHRQRWDQPVVDLSHN